MRRIFLIPLTGILAITLSCSLFLFNSSAVAGPQPAASIESKSWEDQEAEMMALWFSGELVAPTGLNDTIKAELAMIRSQWADSLSFWDDSLYSSSSQFYKNEYRSVRFTPPWFPGQIKLRAKEKLARKILDSSLAGFCDLMRELYIDEWSLDSLRKNRWYRFMKSSRELNSKVMATRFNELTRTKIASPDYIWIPEPNILRRVDSGRTEYFWRHEWQRMKPKSWHYGPPNI